MARSMDAQLQPRTRTRLWQVFAFVLAVLTLVIAWRPPVLRRWSPADILLIALLLAAEWLVLKRIYRHENLGERTRKVKIIWSSLLVGALVLLVISKSR
jgi:ABC-type transport system involved in cytochrome c biogenesis permease component